MCGVGTHRGRRSGGIRAISVADRGPYPARWTRKGGCVCASGRRWGSGSAAGRAREDDARQGRRTYNRSRGNSSIQPATRTRISPSKTISVRAPVPEHGMCFQHAPSGPSSRIDNLRLSVPLLRRLSIRAACSSPLPTCSHPLRQISPSGSSLAISSTHRLTAACTALRRPSP